MVDISLAQVEDRINRNWKSVVYFIRDEFSGRVKIGFTKNLAERLGMIQGGCPGKITLIGVVRGGKAVEAALHLAFAEYRTRGEWFVFGVEMEEWLKVHCPSVDEALTRLRVKAK